MLRRAAFLMRSRNRRGPTGRLGLVLWTLARWLFMAMGDAATEAAE